MKRRQFFRSSAALAACAIAPTLMKAEAQIKSPRANKKGLMYSTMNSATTKALSVRARFQLLKDAGFAGVELPSAMNQSEVLAARDATGLEIPSVLVSTHFAKPLSHPSASVRTAGLDGLKQALRDAKAYGAKSVLLVPAHLSKEVSYADAYARSTEEIAKAVPLAEALGVAIAIENVWNAFLLSPLEAASYVDRFRTPFVRWHFDVGNVINIGWPQHWIQALGARIAAVHVKEYSRAVRDERGPRAGFQVELMSGDSDWPTVMAALDEIPYSGWLIAEQYRPPGLADTAWLAALSAKMDAILSV